MQVMLKPELLSAVKANPPAFINALLIAAGEKLDFGKPNECHIVAYGDKITLQRGYKGWLKLARNSPGVKDVDAFPIYENDRYGRRFGAARTVDLIPAPFGQPKGALIGFAAVAYLTNGGVIFDEITVPEVVDHAKRFIKADKRGPFAGLKEQGVKHENFIPYGLKTIAMRLCNRKLDLSSEAGEAIIQETSEVLLDPQILQQQPTQEPEDLVEVSDFADDFREVKLSKGSLASKKIPQVSPSDLTTYLHEHGDSITDYERNAVISALEAAADAGVLP